MIRSYGDAMQGFMSSYLDESMALFVKQQKAMREQMANLMHNAPLSVFSDMARRNLETWQSMQEGLFTAWGVAGKKDGGDKDPEET